MSETGLAESPRSSRSAGDGAAVLALVLSLIATAFLMFISPVRACSFDGTSETCVIQWDIVWRALAVVAPGVLVSAVPVVALRSRRAALLRTSAAIVLGIVGLGGFLIPLGFLFLPSAVAMSVSALQARRTGRTGGRAGRVLAWISLALAVAAGVTLLFIYGGETCVSRATPVGAPGAETVCTSTTLLESQGPGVIGILLVPIVLALVPVAAGRHRSARALRVLSAVVLMILALLGMLSIGILYVPAVLAMVAAASFDDAAGRLGPEPVAE